MTVPDTHLRDQLGAAAREAATAIKAAGGTPWPGNRLSSPPLDDLLDAWAAAGLAGLTAGCTHVPDSPTVVAGLLHRPGVVYCPLCAMAAMATDMQTNPDRCDGCGYAADRFTELTLALGPIILSANVCPRCDPPRLVDISTPPRLSSGGRRLRRGGRS